MLRSLLLVDGPSDLPLAAHLEAMCADLGFEIEITPIDPRRLGKAKRTIEARLATLLANGADPDVVFVHRDAEKLPPANRRREILAGASAAGLHAPVVPVIPVRMTEAWLLLDEQEIRRVAGRPTGREPLGLPSASQVETVADPKAVLREALLSASGATGRRRARAERDFGEHRSLLLQRLDLRGPVTALAAWQTLRHDITEVLTDLSSAR